MEVDVIEYELNAVSNMYDIYVIDFSKNVNTKIASIRPTYDEVQSKENISHMVDCIANSLGYRERAIK